MSANITEIQAMINDRNMSVSTLLREAKILASNLKQIDFINWIDKELNGYNEDDKVPEYRVISGIPQGYNPYRGWIPYVHTDSKSQEIISTRGIGQSIGQLEEVIKNEKGSLVIKYPPDIEAKLRKGVGFDVDIQLAINKAAVVGILEHVRNTILDWTIKLKGAGISETVSSFSQKNVAEVSEIKPKYHIDHIENFTGNIGEKNDFKSFSGQLISQETFWTKFFWYVLVALVVLIIGNVFSALILKYFL